MKMDISTILTIAFGAVSVIALIYAIQQGKKAKEAEKRLDEIQQAVTSYKFLKEKALDYYLQGRYDESLDVFKRYLFSNKDDTEWNEIIVQIFQKETEKNFSDILFLKDGIRRTMAMYTQIFISYEEMLNKSTSYPMLLKELIYDFENTFGRSKNNMNFLIALFERN